MAGPAILLGKGLKLCDDENGRPAIFISGLAAETTFP